MAIITWLDKIDGSDAGNPQKNVNAADMNQIKTVTNTNAGLITTAQGEIDAHEALTNNPHSVTKTQVGLSNVDNTSDSAKPVSTAQQTAIDGKVANDLTASTTVAPSKTAVNTALTLKLTVTSFKVAVPSGTVNGVNLVFTFPQTPLDGTLVLFSDTSALIENVDYTRAGDVVTLGLAPVSAIFGLYLTT